MTVVHLWRELDHSRIARLSARVDADRLGVRLASPSGSLTITSVIQSKLGTFPTFSTVREKMLPCESWAWAVTTEASSPGSKSTLATSSISARTLVLTESVCGRYSERIARPRDRIQSERSIRTFLGKHDRSA